LAPFVGVDLPRRAQMLCTRAASLRHLAVNNREQADSADSDVIRSARVPKV